MESAKEQRRPLKTRQKGWAIKLAAFLTRYGFSPDHISILGIVFAVAACGSFFAAALTAYKFFYFLAAVCIQLRLLCNMLDGMVAQQSKHKSVFGDLYNEIPDRFEDVIILVSAGYAGMSPFWGWLGAVMALCIVYIRAFGASLTGEQYFIGPMAKPQRMATLTIACIVALFMRNPPQIITFSLIVIVLGGGITCVRRVGRIVNALKR